MSVWLDYKNCTCCNGPGYSTGKHWATVELFKTLILYNEMDTLLRIVSHPDAHLEDLWTVICCWDHAGNGWAELVLKALMVYICLKVFYTKLETHDAAARKEHLASTTPSRKPLPSQEDMNYRRTYAYQLMLIHCTAGWKNDTEANPHRQFFGVDPGMHFGEHGSKEFLGMVRPEQLRCPKACSIKSYRPLRHDIPIVINYLGQMGLPCDLSLQVLEHAEYVPQRRLAVVEDPLHADNSNELRRYLNYCWHLLVRSDILAKACGTKIG